MPLRPIAAPPRLLDRFWPSRREAWKTTIQRLDQEFARVEASWVQDSTGASLGTERTSGNTRFEQEVEQALKRHIDLLNVFGQDIEKFLYQVPVKLARFEAEYSWRFQEELDAELGTLLNGIVAGKEAVDCSPTSLGRRGSDAFSTPFLRAQLEMRFNERRSLPKPGFMATSDYARTLSGCDFERWIETRLREAGCVGVSLTKASHDQGADLIVDLGRRRVVIQAKQKQDSVGNEAVQEVLGALHYYKASEGWVVITSTFTKEARNLAFRSGVKLIEGSQLSTLADQILGSQENRKECSATVDVPCSLALQPVVYDQTPKPVSAADLGPTSAPASKSSAPRFGLRWNWRPKRGTILVLVITAFVILASGIVFFRATNRDRSEQEIHALLEQYQFAIRARNAQAVADCYAPVVERFYLWRDVPRSEILNQFRKNFTTYSKVNTFAISSISFNHLANQRINVSFNRDWNFGGLKPFSGSEKEEMIFIRKSGRWQIASETESKVYWTHHDTGPNGR